MSQVILTNGMPRSGSTWLYNAARLILGGITAPGSFTYGWHEDVKVMNKVTLLKAHGVNHRLLSSASTILYSYRDIRDVLASRKRMWGMEPTLEVARDLVAESTFFDKAAHYVMKYEDFIVDPVSVLNDLTRLFDADELDVHEIHAQLETEKKPASNGKPYNEEELYHTGHITSGKHMDFEKYVSPQMIEAIEDSFGSWFTDRGYTLGTK